MLRGSVEVTLLVVLLAVVFGPVVAERLQLPGIVGQIAAGVLVGPFVLDWVPAEGLAQELGAIGILYLMFLAGITFDLRAFAENRRVAISYGLLGFVVPFGLTFVVIAGLSDLSVLGAALIGAMWASNTLVALPQVQAAGLMGNRAVSAAVSGGVVADLLSLTVLGVATATAVVEIEPLADTIMLELAELVGDGVLEPSTPDPTLPVWLGLPLLVGFCLWALPRAARWFFTAVGRSRSQRFVFALAGMAAGASVALLGGLEGLIGAFLAGLGLNRLVPTESQLMDRLDFVGSSLFVPAFLVSIGLTIDPALLVDPATLLVGALFVLLVVVGKGTAAVVTGRRHGLSTDEIGLMSSLSFGQAASTLAIAQVGQELGLFDQAVVNASVIAIVGTALLTSIGTRFYVRRIPAPRVDRAPLGGSVLLDVRDTGADLPLLVEVAARLAADDDGVVVPYGVGPPDDLGSTRRAVGEASALLAARGLDADGVVRADTSFSGGTTSLVVERRCSSVVLSWGGPTTVDVLFGNEIDGIGAVTPVPAMAVHVVRPWRRVVVVRGEQTSAWQQEDAASALAVAERLRRDDETPLLLVSRSADDEHPGDGVELLATDGRDRRLVDALADDDLVVATAHAVRHLSPLAHRRVVRHLRGMNVVVVGGPRRLVVSRGATRGRAVAAGPVTG